MGCWPQNKYNWHKSVFMVYSWCSSVFVSNLTIFVQRSLKVFKLFLLWTRNYGLIISLGIFGSSYWSLISQGLSFTSQIDFAPCVSLFIFFIFYASSSKLKIIIDKCCYEPWSTEDQLSCFNCYYWSNFNCPLGTNKLRFFKK